MEVDLIIHSSNIAEISSEENSEDLKQLEVNLDRTEDYIHDLFQQQLQKLPTLIEKV